MPKKVGYDDLDPDLISFLREKASTSPLVYDDTEIKGLINSVESDVEDFRVNGSPKEFNKNLDKFTIDMLNDELSSNLRRAVGESSGIDQNEQTAIFDDKLDDLENSKYVEETSLRESTDTNHAERIEQINQSIDDILFIFKNACYEVIESKNMAMIGALKDSDGKRGKAPAPSKGAQNMILCGGGMWKDPNYMLVGGALHDDNGQDILSYIKDVAYDENNKVLTFTRGDGTALDIPLDKVI